LHLDGARLQPEIGNRRYQCDHVIPLTWRDDSGPQPIVETGQVRFRALCRDKNGESAGNRIPSREVIPLRAASAQTPPVVPEHRNRATSLAAGVPFGGLVRSGEVKPLSVLTWRARSTNRALYREAAFTGGRFY
jgi:hypothetical protein